MSHVPCDDECRRANHCGGMRECRRCEHECCPLELNDDGYCWDCEAFIQDDTEEEEEEEEGEE